MSDTLSKLGKTIETVEGRDAVHIAVVPVTVVGWAGPGQHVGFVDATTVSAKITPYVGIIDPFLPDSVDAGARVWLFLYPNTITSLRHVWTHPSVPDEVGVSAVPEKPSSKEESEAWLRRFVAAADCPDYDVLMAAATGDHEKNKGTDGDEDYTNSSNDGEYHHFGGRDAHGDIPDEFWDHVEVVSGMKIPRGWRARYFSCSC